MRGILKSFLDLACRYGFFKTDKNEIIFGSMANLLSNNIRCEWHNDSVSLEDTSLSVISGDLSTKWQDDCYPLFKQHLQLSNDKLPFGLVFMLRDITLPVNGKGIKKDNWFQSKTNLYRCLRFIDPEKSQQYFYRLQRSRNIWWRKFARDPEVFQINEVKGNEKEETVEIVAKLPWIEETVETISSYGSRPLETFGTIFEVKIGRKRVLPHVIESVCLEAPATVAYLCDAYHPSQPRTLLRLHHRLTPYKAAVVIDTVKIGRKRVLPHVIESVCLEAPATVAYLCDAYHPSQPRTLLRLHHRLTPYKAAVVIDTVDGFSKELKLLADFLNLSLCRAGLFTLSSFDKANERGVDYLFTKHDQLGIPYTLVLRDETLHNGIAGLRSRDTTLQEQVHLRRITPYMQQLFRK